MTKGMFVKFLVKRTKYEGIALLHEDLYFFSELLDDTYQFLVSLPTRWIYMVICFNFLSPYLYGGIDISCDYWKSIICKRTTTSVSLGQVLAGLDSRLSMVSILFKGSVVVLV